MISRSRFVVTLGLVMALGVAALAFADGASENTPRVIGKISPTKLADEQKKVALEAGVETDVTVTGSQQNPEAEIISFGKVLGWDSNAAPLCTVPLDGTTTDQAKAACEAQVGNGKSNLGAGDAAVKTSETRTISDLTVTGFNGPKKNQVRLHAYSPTLTAASTVVVLGKIVKSPDGKKYDRALSVPDAPDAGDDAFAITRFTTKVKKKSGVTVASCEASKFPVKRTVTYDDGSKESVTTRQKLNC